MSVFTVEALPAQEGDCLLITYGADSASVFRIVVDAGHPRTGKALAKRLVDAGLDCIELLVVTHIDADHIEGTVDFLQAVAGRIEIRDVWFNGWKHLGMDTFGAEMGEELTTLVKQLRWNGIVDGAPIKVAADGEPVALPPLPGGMRMTVLSPDDAKLRRMAPVWEREVRAAGLVPGEGKPVETASPPGFEALGGDVETLAATVTKDDRAAANGTSIALLAEWDGIRVLLGADAHPDLLTASLRRMGDGTPVRLDLMKVPHHGSQANVTRALLEAVDCRDFLISTDGTKFRHPDEVAIARIVASRTDGVRLRFNYRQKRTTLWEDRASTETAHPFRCDFPAADGEPLVVELGVRLRGS